MGFFKQLVTPSIPNINNTAGIVDWFFSNDDNIREAINSVPDQHRLNLRDTIISVIDDCSSAVELQEQINEAFQVYRSCQHMVERFQSAKAIGFDSQIEANAAINAAAKAFVIEACSSTMLRLYGYFISRKYGVEPTLNDTSGNPHVDTTSAENISPGDLLLQRESADANVARNLALVRREGATDDDIRWWWNLSKEEQEAIKKQDIQARTSYMADLMHSQKISMADAGEALWKRFPTYGDPKESPQRTGEDRRLPYELKARIDSYIEQRKQNDFEAYQRDLDKSSTFNALIRSEIRDGNL